MASLWLIAFGFCLGLVWRVFQAWRIERMPEALAAFDRRERDAFIAWQAEIQSKGILFHAPGFRPIDPYARRLSRRVLANALGMGRDGLLPVRRWVGAFKNRA
jgi:hypothetical protein